MEEIRVRFAPSPTGFVHVGSLRTVLYNYLFARHHHGKLILRIEDTDQARYVDGTVENLIKTLSWAGLEYDEGPEVNGNFGPYFQSQRLDIYKEQVKLLLDKREAYPCFCTTERLNKMREAQISRGEDARYDGVCRNIEKAEALVRMQTESNVVRMKVPEGKEVVVDDLIHGQVLFQSDLLDDQILIKSDGYPTYHFANVIDDHFMQINHVIRGEEWLPSTPKHVLLYKAFGWKLPQFAHLPLLLNKDRSKLSKRQGDVAVEDYQVKGILSDALINFVALLGWNKGDDQEIFTIDELIESFTLERVNKSGAVFDLDKLNWMNGQYIRKLPEDEYVKEALKWLDKAGLDAGTPHKNEQIVLAVRNHLNKYDEVGEATRLFFSEKLEYASEALDLLKLENSKILFQKMLDELKTMDELTLEVFKAVMQNVQKETGIKGKDLWMPVRAAITGQTAGPELPVVLSVIGKERVMSFLNQALNN